MLLLLKNIRRKLTIENRITTYLLYAIGEITLVVIGILIAVSIDNWNESNRLQKLEKKLLQEMISDLEVQADDITSNILTHRSSLKSCQIILNALTEDQPFHDSLMLHFGKTYEFTVFENKQGAYKMLENQGIALIRDDSLRMQITSYFDVSIVFQLEVQRVTIQQIQAASENHLKLFKNFNWSTPLQPWDFEALKRNKEYISWLSYASSNKAFEVKRFEQLLKKNRSLIQKIKQELSEI